MTRALGYVVPRLGRLLWPVAVLCSLAALAVLVVRDQLAPK